MIPTKAVKATSSSASELPPEKTSEILTMRYLNNISAGCEEPEDEREHHVLCWGVR